MSVSRRVRRWLAAVGGVAVLCWPAGAAGQAHGIVRGRVIDSDGAPLAGVEITARSQALVAAMTTLSIGDGTFVLASLPPGDYVIAFAREDLVPLKVVTTLAAAQRRAVDVAMAAAPEDDGQLMTVRIDDSLLERRALTTTSWGDRLETQPLLGGLESALHLAAGPIVAEPDDALIRFDGWRLALVPADQLPPLRDAIRSVTVATAGLDADVGWTLGGLADVVTQPGADRWTASARYTLGNQDLHADRPSSARQTDDPTLIGEYALGGPVRAGRSWVFAAAQHAGQTLANRTLLAGEPYDAETDRRFLELRATHALNARHRVAAEWLSFSTQARDAGPDDWGRAGGLDALEDREWSSGRGSASYDGMAGERLALSASFAAAESATEGSVGPDAVPAARTRVVDQASGLSWAAPACAGCGEHTRDHLTWRVTGSMLLPGTRGSHHVFAGYEGLRDRDQAGRLPDGGAFELRASNVVLADGALAPVLRPDGSTWLVWTPERRPDLDLTGHALFVGDRWRWREHLTLDLGVRWDRFAIDRGELGEGWTEQAFSPRAFASWTPGAHSPWLVRGGVARYARPSVTSAYGASFVDAPVRRIYAYDGPPLNTGGESIDTAAAVDQALGWFFGGGGTSRMPDLIVGASTPADGMRPATVTEWVAGVDREIGLRSHLRIDLFRRDYGDIPAREALPGAGSPAPSGALSDAVRLERHHVGLAIHGAYRLGVQARLGGSYTLSRLSGNAVPRSAEPWTARAALAYPEYVSPAWSAREDDLPGDVRHRYRLWAEADALIDEEGLGVLTVTLLQSVESGRPYGAMGLVDARPYTDNPGYAQPPLAVPYAFTAADAFRTESVARADLALSYWRRLPGTLYGQLFVQFHVLNLFDDDNLVDPAGTVVVRTAYTDPDRFEPFDPLQETPVQGRHWDVDPRWDAGSLPGLVFTMPRTLRLSMGVRF